MTNRYTPHVGALLTVSLAGVLLAASPAAAASDCNGSTISGSNASVVTGSCLVPSGVTSVRIDAIGGGGGGGASSLGNAAGRGGHAAMVTTYQQVTPGAELFYTVGGGGGGGLKGGAASANTFGGVGFTTGGIPGPMGTAGGTGNPGLTKPLGGGGGGSTRVVSGTDVDVIAGGGGGGGGVAGASSPFGTKGGDAAAAGTAAGQVGSSDAGRGGGGASPPTGGIGGTSNGVTGGNGLLGTGGNGGGTGVTNANGTGGGGGGGYGGGGGGGGAALTGGGGSGGSYRGGVGSATATTIYKAVSTGAGKGGDGGGAGGTASAGAAGTAGSVTITALNQAAITATTPGERQVDVSWTEPAQPAGLTVTYQVYVDGVAVPGATSSPATVTGLTYGTSYSLTVVATTAEGLVTTSEAAMASPTATAPGPPVISSVVPGDAQAVVTFAAPASDGGAAVTGYQYRVGAGSWSAATSPQTITGLTNGQSAAVEVRAVNAVGNGGSASSSVRPQANPIAPSGLVTYNLNQSSASATWNPESAVWSSPLAAYQVVYRRQATGGAWATYAYGSTSATPSVSLSVSGCGGGWTSCMRYWGYTPGVTYEFRVFARGVNAKNGYMTTAFTHTPAL